jgi:hypothetical protein
VVGPQQAGKSRFIIGFCQEIIRERPEIVITIIDPKGGFRDYASVLNAKVINLSKKSFDLRAPLGVSREDHVHEFVPPLCDTGGLIYGVEPVSEAVSIALDQRQKYAAETGQDTELCLKDICVALSLVGGANSGRRMGYREAAQTALSRIMGRKNLFACRRGISMEQLFSQNAILDARSLVDDMQCRALALYLLYWKYQQCRYKPETNKLAHLIIFDDASRWFGTPGDQFGAASRTSPIGHILALLRSAGAGVCVATQLPAFLDPSLPALSRTMVAVGPTSGSQHLKVVSDFMSLDKEQAKAITRLSTQEAVAFSPGCAYKECIHGWVRFVDDPPTTAPGRNIEVEDNYSTEPWSNLAEIPAPTTTVSRASTQQRPVQGLEETPSVLHPNLHGISSDVQTLLWDVKAYPFHSVSARIKRLRMSGRLFDRAKLEAIERGLLIESKAGHTVYLTLTQKAFDAFGIPNPFKRSTSMEHAFFVGLACFLLEQDSRYARVRPEVPLGRSGSASDVVTTCHDGTLEAWEICLGTAWILTNVTKYKQTAFAKIVLLARTHELSMATKSFIKASGLDPDLMAKVEYMHFSQLLRRQRKLSRY